MATKHLPSQGLHKCGEISMATEHLPFHGLHQGGEINVAAYRRPSWGLHKCAKRWGGVGWLTWLQNNYAYSELAKPLNHHQTPFL